MKAALLVLLASAVAVYAKQRPATSILWPTKVKEDVERYNVFYSEWDGDDGFTRHSFTYDSSLFDFKYAESWMNYIDTQWYKEDIAFCRTIGNVQCHTWHTGQYRRRGLCAGTVLKQEGNKCYSTKYVLESKTNINFGSIIKGGRKQEKEINVSGNCDYCTAFNPTVCSEEQETVNGEQRCTITYDASVLKFGGKNESYTGISQAQCIEKCEMANTCVKTKHSGMMMVQKCELTFSKRFAKIKDDLHIPNWVTVELRLRDIPNGKEYYKESTMTMA